MKKAPAVWFAACLLCIVGTLASGVISGAAVAPVLSAWAGHSSAASAVLTRAGAVSASSGSDNLPSAAPSGQASSAVTLSPAAARDDFRAVWIATVSNINFPSRPGLSADAQKKEIDTILDNAKKDGLRTVIVQMRPDCDALYASKIYPWSAVLTGTEGKNPGYDPLQYFVEGAHSRGLKLEAWLNPYRIQGKADLSKLAASSPARKHTDWTVKGNDGGLYFDPGLPQVRSLIEAGVMEIVNHYAVDGIVFDDYFYPEKNFADDASYKKYGGGKDRGDWRRENVDTLVREIHDQIKASGKNVVFGMCPFAVWANKSDNPAGSDTRAFESYYDQYADTRLWVQKGYIDYICPQIYWQIGYSLADYAKVLDWWVNTVKGTGVKLYVAHAVYRMASSSSGWPADEIMNQLALAGKYAEYAGSSFYGYAQIAANTDGIADRLAAYYGVK